MVEPKFEPYLTNFRTLTLNYYSLIIINVMIKTNTTGKGQITRVTESKHDDQK